MYTTQEAAKALGLRPRNFLAYAKSRGIEPMRRVGKNCVWGRGTLRKVARMRNATTRARSKA